MNQSRAVDARLIVCAVAPTETDSSARYNFLELSHGFSWPVQPSSTPSIRRNPIRYVVRRGAGMLPFQASTPASTLRP